MRFGYALAPFGCPIFLKAPLLQNRTAALRRTVVNILIGQMLPKFAKKLNRLKGLRGLQGVQQIARYRYIALPDLSLIPIGRTVQDIARLSGNVLHEACKYFGWILMLRASWVYT